MPPTRSIHENDPERDGAGPGHGNDIAARRAAPQAPQPTNQAAGDHPNYQVRGPLRGVQRPDVQRRWPPRSRRVAQWRGRRARRDEGRMKSSLGEAMHAMRPYRGLSNANYTANPAISDSSYAAFPRERQPRNAVLSGRSIVAESAMSRHLNELSDVSRDVASVLCCVQSPYSVRGRRRAPIVASRRPTTRRPPDCARRVHPD
jgi:hypothetical protein